MYPLDADGYLIPSHDPPVPAVATLFDTGGAVSRFQRLVLEGALARYGEDELLDRVRRGLTRAEVDAIGAQHALLVTTPDPGRPSGVGYPRDKALAMAAVRVLDADRPTGRGRRRRT